MVIGTQMNKRENKIDKIVLLPTWIFNVPKGALNSETENEFLQRQSTLLPRQVVRTWLLAGSDIDDRNIEWTLDSATSKTAYL